MSFPIYSVLRSKAETMDDLNSNQILFLSKVFIHFKSIEDLEFIYALIHHHALINNNYDFNNKIPYGGSFIFKTNDKSPMGIGPTFTISNLPPLLVKILHVAVQELTV